MAKETSDAYNNSIIERFRDIINICDLTVSGLNAFSGISESHIYAILNGHRKLTPEIAGILGTLLNFDRNLIFNLNKSIPGSICKSDNLNKFKIEHKNNIEYFASKVLLYKKSYLISGILESFDLVEKPQYLSDIRSFVNSRGKIKYSSDELSKALNYLVVQKKLLKKKKLKVLKTGKLGKRLFDVFYREK